MTGMLAGLLAAMTVFQVDPWHHEPILPDRDPPSGRPTEAISFAAAKGEFEAVSFVASPDRAYAKVDVVATDLAGPDGAKIPASAADVASVKVWFRPEGRWRHSYVGNRLKPTPINTLVLHDDSLVRVDWERKVNYLRADYATGTRYLDISHGDRKTPFDYDCQPVRDAKSFVPFDLKERFRQQYLVTWHVPADARPGDYSGRIEFREDGKSVVKTVALSLRVYPFALPSPRTHYDPTAPYAVSLAEVGDLSSDSFDSLGLRTLVIARQEGMCADPIVNGSSYMLKDRFVWSPNEPLLEPEEHPQRYADSLERFTKRLRAQQAVMDRYLGHHRCCYTSPDECPYGMVRRSYGYMSRVRELGGLCWTDAAFADKIGFANDVNVAASRIDHRIAWGWHRSGAKCMTYAATFTGTECPDVWRRNKGIRFWYADYDGQHEYALFEGVNRWNDFVGDGPFCQFGIVYFTQDGLVPTLAWEASATLAAALKLPGATEEERSSAVKKMADAYFSSGEYDRCVQYVEKAVKEVVMKPRRVAVLYITVGNALKQQGKWKEALKAYREAHRQHNGFTGDSPSDGVFFGGAYGRII